MVLMLSTGLFGCTRLARSRLGLGLCFLLGLAASFIGSLQEGLATDISYSASAYAVTNTTKKKRTRIAAKPEKKSRDQSKKTSRLRSRHKNLNGPLQIVVSLSQGLSMFTKLA